MVGRVADLIKSTVHVRERSSTRSSVLDAARRLAEREGIDAISLSAVASEAGLARATVYGIFRSKEDLLHSVVASDLDVIAQMMRAAAGLPEPPSFKPPPSKIVRFDNARVEEFRKESEARVREAAGPETHANEDDAASTPDEIAVANASDPVLLIEHRRSEDESSGVALQAPEFVVDVPSPAFDTPIAAAAADGELFAAPYASPAVDPEDAGEIETPAAVPAEQSFASALAEAIQGPAVEAPVEKASEPTEETVEATAAAESAAEPVVTAAAGLTADSQASASADTESGTAAAPLLEKTEETEPEPEKVADAKPLEPRLPARGERIRISGKRVLATPELKETMKRLAPAYSAEGDAQAEAVAKLQETVSKLESGRADNLERRVHLLEGALADLTARHEKTVEAHASTATTVAESLGTVVKRIDESEKRLRDSMARMMAEVRDAARRLDEMDFNDRADAARAELLSEPEHHDDGQHDEIPGDDELGGAPEADEHDAGKDGEETNTYLSAARRSAVTAAQAAAESAQVERARRMKLTRTLTIGVVGLAIVLGAAGVALNRFSHAPAPKPEADVSITLRRGGQGITHMHRLAHATHASAAPLDRLAAMANGGNAGAELIVGLRYLNGEGVAKSDVEGAKWIIRAANAGDPVAEFWAGSLYQHGRGVAAADPVQAVAWYQRAALKGNRKAMHDLGIDYALGLGVPKDYEQAARWFSQAANLGYVDSEFNLAVLYERGDGVPQSLLDAYKWYAIAAAQGDAESKAHVDAIATQLSPDDLAAAQAAAQNFKPIEPAPEANGAPTEAMLLARY
jgi:TPR repeat protein